MKNNNAIRVLIAIISVAVVIYLLYPSVIFYSKNAEQKEAYISSHPFIFKKIVNLGLDLQGGMRLVLEIDDSKVDPKQQKDLLDRAYTIIENRINALGVAEPSIQKQGDDRIIVELPGLKDEEKAKNVIGQTAQLEFNLLREPVQLEHAITIIDNVLAGKAPKDTVTDSTKANDSLFAQKQAEQGMAEKLFKGAEGTVDTDTAVVKNEQITSMKELLVQAGDQIGVSINHVATINQILRRKDVQEGLQRAGLGSNAFLWAHDTLHLNNTIFRALYYVKASPEMRGDAIMDAQASIDQSGMRAGGAKVDLEMNPKGARRFSSVTAANVNKFLAIVLDSAVYSAPRIIQKIPLGRAEITGNFSMEEAKNLSIVLRAGALPAPVRIIEERTVGPSLGQDSIKASFIAGFVGFIVILLFMGFYYRISGLLAIAALILNVLGVLAILAGINATLTLPGIAGIILQIGMAVDANVLILERIREELRSGKTSQGAIKAGFDRAFTTIMDSNLTTLVTAFILLWKGTGPIRGFAVTLIFGLMISLFTALFIARLLMDMTFQKNKTKLSI